MSNNYNTTLQTNNSDLQAILNTINKLPEAGGSEPNLQDKTISPSTSAQTVKADSGYDGLDTVTVNAMPTATQATPSITVNTSGLITATATQAAGYVTEGSKSGTKQLAFQPAKTITPGTTSQVAVSSGYYTGGNITVAAVPTQSKTVTPTSTTQNIIPDSGKFLSKVTVNGDSDLVASNIKNGVSIFGVTGTYEGSGSGGNADVEDSLITRNITTYTNNRVKTIGSYAFYYCSRLTSVNFPACTTIGNYAFSYCTSLTSVNFPACTTIGSSAFDYCCTLTSANFPACITIKGSAFCNCSRLTSVSFPACTTIGSYAFINCSRLTSVNFPACTTISNSAFINCYSLTSANFPACTTIGSYAFINCSNLKSLYLMGSSLCRLSNSNAFYSTPIGGYSASAGTYGSIYVPASLLTSYKTATNWTYFSNRFVGI